MKKGMLSNIKYVMRLCSFMLILVLLPGCKGERKICDTCLHEIYAPLLHDEPTDFPRISSLCESIDTVYLENSCVESMIPSVDEVVSFGDTIIIRSSGSLFFFNRNGKFLSRFDRQGKGSGNYRTIDRFDILPDRKELYVLDSYTNRVIVYDMGGQFKRQVEISDFVTDFAVLPDGDMLFTNPIKYSGKDYRRGLWRTGPDGRFKKQLVSYDPDFAHVSINNPYINHISPGVIGFMGIEDNDKFYTYTGDSVVVTCRMTTDIVIPNEMKDNDKVHVNPEKEYTKCGYLETNRFLYFVATNYGANLMMAFTDKRDWTTYRMYVYSSDFQNNTERLEPFPFLVGCYNGTLVGFYDSGMILDNERNRAQFPTITADSNPVLFFFRE